MKAEWDITAAEMLAVVMKCVIGYREEDVHADLGRDRSVGGI